MKQHPGPQVVAVQAPRYTSLPGNLLTLAELAARVPIAPERIAVLTRSGHMPCWYIDGVPMYRVADVKRFAAENLLTEQPGAPLPRVVEVSLDKPPDPGAVPAELRAMVSTLRHTLRAAPGVYFLVRDAFTSPGIACPVVVYVGQSTNVHARVATHHNEASKNFDRAYYLPVPDTELLRVEAAFIRILRPEYNRENILNRDATPDDHAAIVAVGGADVADAPQH